MPNYKNYDCAIILGTTGPTHYQLCKDLIKFYNQQQISFSKIFLLGGDRKVHSLYDNLDIVYKNHPEDFNKLLTEDDIISTGNEMELMKLIISTLKLPKELMEIPIIPVYSKKSKFNQADTEDTFNQLLSEYKLSRELPQ